MIRINPQISLNDDEVTVEFVRASGPGGQNVNKVATACQLRLDVLNSPSLPQEVKVRLIRLAGSRLTTQGELIIDARRHRTQARNREDAMERLVELIARAAVAPKPRRKTKASYASKLRRLESKKRRSEIKGLRRTPE